MIGANSGAPHGELGSCPPHFGFDLVLLIFCDRVSLYSFSLCWHSVDQASPASASRVLGAGLKACTTNARLDLVKG